MATDIFSIIEGLTVTKEEILEAELFAQQFLEAQFPTYDFRQGTAIRDMVIRPNAMLLSLIQKSLQFYYDDTDILNFTNATDNDLVDRKLSNFFLTRLAGTNSTLKARLFFSFPGDPVAAQIPQTAFFSTDNEIKFYPTTTVTARPPVAQPIDGLVYYQFDSEQGLWYVDIDLTSGSTGTEYNIESGDLLYFTIFSPYFIRGSIQYLTEVSVPQETNEELRDRAYTAVSTRNLINNPSIIAGIKDNFNYINALFPVGLGSPYLYRDLLNILEVEDPLNPWDPPRPPEIVSYHRGGTVDILAETTPVTTTQQYALDANSEIILTGPVIAVSRSATPPAGSEADFIPAGIEPTVELRDISAYTDSVPADPSKDYGLSAKQTTVVTFPGYNPGDTASLDIQVFQGIDSLQAYLEADANRVVAADYLARSFEPEFIDITIQVRTAIADDQPLYDALETYVNGIINGGTIYMSEIVQTITGANVENFIMPITVSSTHIARDLQQTTVAVTDSHDILPVRKFRLRNLVITEA